MKSTVMILATAAVLAGCGSASTPDGPAPTSAPTGPVGPATLSVQGQITVADGLSVDGPGSQCVTSGTGYDDIEAGTAVVVKDSTGAQVAIGRLGAGVTSPDSTKFVVRCVFPFSVRDVPTDSPTETPPDQQPSGLGRGASCSAGSVSTSGRAG